MFKKGDKFYSIVRGKCPRCNEGNFFEHSFSLHPGKIIKIHKHCSHCNLKYMIEPSFFYGAMYVNYALTVAIIVASFLLFKVILNFSIANSFLSVGISSILISPFNLRLSRVLWIHMFIKYEQEYAKKND